MWSMDDGCLQTLILAADLQATQNVALENREVKHDINGRR